MNHLFVPYEQALALKELGFDEPCFGYYNNDNQFTFFVDVRSCNTNSEFGFFPTAPTLSQAFDFFEKKFNLYGQTYTYTEEFGNKQPKFGWEIRDYGEQWTGKSGFDTKREAELDCLRELVFTVRRAPAAMLAFGYVLPNLKTKK